MKDTAKLCYDNIQIGDKVRIAIDNRSGWIYRFDEMGYGRDKVNGKLTWHACEVVEKIEGKNPCWLIALDKSEGKVPLHFWSVSEYPDKWISDIDRSEYIHAVIKSSR